MTGRVRHTWTTLRVEFPCAEGDPYYPVQRPGNRDLHRYERISEEEGA